MMRSLQQIPRNSIAIPLPLFGRFRESASGLRRFACVEARLERTQRHALLFGNSDKLLSNTPPSNPHINELIGGRTPRHILIGSAAASALAFPGAATPGDAMAADARAAASTGASSCSPVRRPTAAARVAAPCTHQTPSPAPAGAGSTTNASCRAGPT